MYLHKFYPSSFPNPKNRLIQEAVAIRRFIRGRYFPQVESIFPTNPHHMFLQPSYLETSRGGVSQTTPQILGGGNASTSWLFPPTF